MSRTGAARESQHVWLRTGEESVRGGCRPAIRMGQGIVGWLRRTSMVRKE
ncbi:hypothetical protein [Staphylospora marina]|nr:hypothetical protein [Staphylospora marina]